MPQSIRAKILVVFYISSVTTLLGFIFIYFFTQRQNELTEQSPRLQAVVESWSQAILGMNHAIAAHRGWMLFGAERFNIELQEAWDKEVDPAIEDLNVVYSKERAQGKNREEVRTFYDIRLLIETLRVQQKLVEKEVRNAELKEGDNRTQISHKAHTLEAYVKASRVMRTQTIPLAHDIEKQIQKILKKQSDMAVANNLKVQEELNTMRNLILMIALLIFVFGWILSAFLGRQISSALHELRDAVRLVKDDGFYGYIEIQTHDEIGELAHEFSAMLEAIRDRSEDLMTANAKLEIASRAKNEFLANMSHELRTPLTAIIGFTEALLDEDEDEPLSDYQKDRIQRVDQSGRHLRDLINSLLNLSKMEAGRMPIVYEDFHIDELLHEVLHLLDPLMEDKSLTRELVLEGEENTFFCHSDSGKLRQVMINLLGNAIKFTDNGGHIIVCLRRNDWDFTISVQDNGCGIHEDQQDSIFEMFRQADGSATEYHEGTGLGLALVQNLMRLLKGSIEVQSELKVGSTFTISIPRDRQDDELILPHPS